MVNFTESFTFLLLAEVVNISFSGINKSRREIPG